MVTVRFTRRAKGGEWEVVFSAMSIRKPSATQSAGGGRGRKGLPFDRRPYRAAADQTVIPEGIVIDPIQKSAGFQSSDFGNLTRQESSKSIRYFFARWPPHIRQGARWSSDAQLPFRAMSIHQPSRTQSAGGGRGRKGLPFDRRPYRAAADQTVIPEGGSSSTHYKSPPAFSRRTS